MKNLIGSSIKFLKLKIIPLIAKNNKQTIMAKIILFLVLILAKYYYCQSQLEFNDHIKAESGSSDNLVCMNNPLYNYNSRNHGVYDLWIK